ncbi:MAG: DUF72 domain-containing protein [Planctomycetota bacterium]|jgi:uncharacterized protein YecE (DUF72 family)
MSGQAYVGTSGFTYDHWREVFYPARVPQRKWLEYYCEHFHTVEINASYYHMPRLTVCESWRRRSPDGFCFVMKLNQWITHKRRLVDCAEPLEAFLEAVDGLGQKLGPILVQLPPSFHAEPAVLARFLKICPQRYRWAVEFRHASWLCREVYDRLSEHNAALVVHDHYVIPSHPPVVTTDWTYWRFHGTGARCGGNYMDEQLRELAEVIRGQLAGGLDVYSYFNNDAEGYAIRNAQRFRELVADG